MNQPGIFQKGLIGKAEQLYCNNKRALDYARLFYSLHNSNIYIFNPLFCDEG